MRKSNEPADRQSARTGKATRLEESSVFAPRPRLAASNKVEYKNPAWRKGLLMGALAIAMGIVLFLTVGSLGTQNTSQLAGFAGGGADTETPTSTSTSTNIPTSTTVPTATQTFTPTVTFTPTIGVGSAWIRPADGMVMMYVPAGAFTMGISADLALAECQKFRDECHIDWFADEGPPHVVELDAYWMDRTEVTNAMYVLCVNAGACKPPRLEGSYDVEDYYDNPQYADYPVVFMDWKQANAYCQWAGARLPTEAEWEKAARGTDERPYPWGDSAPSCSLLNFHPFNGAACKGDTSASGDYSDGQSPYQILNLAGNVYEWVSDWYDRSYYSNSPTSNPQGPTSGQARIMRGGSWYFDEAFARATYRYKQDARYYFSFTGIRCVRSE